MHVPALLSPSGVHSCGVQVRQNECAAEVAPAAVGVFFVLWIIIKQHEQSITNVRKQESMGH